MRDLLDNQTNDEADLVELIDEITYRLSQGESVSPDQYVPRDAAQAERLKALFPTLQLLAGMREPVDAKLDIANKAPPSADSSQIALGDYRLLREVGRGGMGVVYEAMQLSLSRRVALKVLPFASVLDPRQLKRFENEAQAAAVVDHANIVPVYSMGCDRGVHYYAMQFIDGQTLSAVIADLRVHQNVEKQGEAPKEHQESTHVERLAEDDVAAQSDCAQRIAREQSSTVDRAETAKCDDTDRKARTAASTHVSGAKQSYYRKVAHFGIQIASALESAHKEGVVHRDIKPSNLILDTLGKVWVTDFGLAHLERGVGLTTTGDMLGTLRYASPEQALGERRLIDCRTDIYSLGATLYELLTLRPIFVGENREELLRQVTSDEPVPLRRYAPSLPVDLETIVLKAVGKAPADRYESADDFAEDLRRFLDRKPIRARRPSVLDRLGKWASRHATGIAVATVVLALAVIGLAGHTVSLVHARRQTETARLRAEDNFERAQQAVDRLLTRVGEIRLKDVPQMERVRKDLLQDALEFYEELLEGNEGRSETQWARGSALVRLAEIHRLLGQHTRSKDAFEQGIVLLEKLQEQEPDDVAHFVQLVGSRYRFANLLVIMGRLRDAEAVYRQVVADCQPLVDSGNASNEVLHVLAQANASLANALAETGRYDEAEALFLQSIGALEQHDRNDLANTYNNLGNAFFNGGHYTKADEAYRVALEARKSLAESLPNSASLREELAHTYNNLGAVSFELARPVDTESFLAAAVNVQEELAADFPSVPDYRWAVAVAYGNLAVLHKQAEKWDEAERELNQAIVILEELTKLYRGSSKYLENLAAFHSNLGNLLRATKHNERAEVALREAVGDFEELPDDARESPSARLQLARTLNNLGFLLNDMKRLDEAETTLRQSMDVLVELVNQFGDSPAFRAEIDRQLSALRNVLIHMRTAEFRDMAERAYQRTIAILEQFAAEYPDTVLYREKLRNFLTTYGDHLFLIAGKLPAAEQAYQRAVDIGDALVRDFPNEPALRASVANSLNNLSNLLVEMGQFEEAHKQCDRAISEYEQLQLQLSDNETYRNNQKACLGTLGMIAAAMGDYATAVEAYRRGLSLPGDFGKARIESELAAILADCPVADICDPAEALALAENAVNAEPKNDQHWETLGVARFGNGDWQGAIEAFEHSEGSVQHWLLTSIAHGHLGKTVESRQFYQKATQWLAKNNPRDEMKFPAQKDAHAAKIEGLCVEAEELLEATPH